MIYPAEIDSYSKRMGISPEQMIKETVTSVRFYIFYYIVILMSASVFVIISLQLINAESVIFDILGAFIYLSTFMGFIIFSVMVTRTIIRSITEPTKLAIEMLVEEEQKFNITKDIEE